MRTGAMGERGLGRGSSGSASGAGAGLRLGAVGGGVQGVEMDDETVNARLSFYAQRRKHSAACTALQLPVRTARRLLRASLPLLPPPPPSFPNRLRIIKPPQFIHA